LFFFSGAVALVYEVLWMKELGILFGNTAYATSATLAAMFLGLSTGGWIWGNRAQKLNNPLLTYGLLELAVAISVVGYFFILDAYHQLYPVIFALFEPTRPVFVVVKFVLALLLLFPPSFFMGGTLPIMSQATIRSKTLLGSRVSILYGVNTLGAALGAFFCGFYFPVWLGFANTYFLAIGITVGVGLLAVWLSRTYQTQPKPEKDKAEKNIFLLENGLSMEALQFMALLSGIVTIGLQVLWTRMFAQVLQNSVYTFSAILVVFLLCLAIGAGLANRLISLKTAPLTILFGLLTSSAILVSTSPLAFNFWTDGLLNVGSGRGWDAYVLSVLGITFSVMGPSVILLGAIFPFLTKLAQPYVKSSGRVVGQLVAINTLGAMIGSIIAGFVILEYMGLWAGIRLMGIIYLLMAMHLFYRYCDLNPAIVAVPLSCLLAVVSFLDVSRLPIVRIDPVNEEESLLQVWEGSDATVAVVRKPNSVKIKLNNYYTLGGSGSRELEALQGYMPILLHPHPQSVFFLGLGTGITAGAALHMPIQRLVAAELSPEVILASKKYFSQYNNRLFYDKRATIVAEDGRNYLAGTNERFDVIIADLFVPWKAGTGSLFTFENFQSISNRLRPGGLFMQWLPAYQLSKSEFSMIARAMQTVFPQVTLWRGDFSARKPVLGLLGQTVIAPLSAKALLFSEKQMKRGEGRVSMLSHYVGNLKNLKAIFGAYPLNTDDMPIIEYQAPITQRIQNVDRIHWLIEDDLIRFLDKVVKSLPAGEDSFLRELGPNSRQLPSAGQFLHRAHVAKQAGRLHEAEDQANQYQWIMESISNHSKPK